jgi:hypothetical protein
VSVAASKWAARQPVGTSMGKLVLMALANCVNRKAVDVAWPSVAHLAEVCRTGERTVRRELHHLQATGLIEDSGQRRGRTLQIKVWRLRLDEDVLPLKRSKRNAKRGEMNGEPLLFPLPKVVTHVSLSKTERLPTTTLKTATGVTRKGKERSSLQEAAAPPEKIDSVKQVFDLGVAVLVETGVAEAKARSLIGHWRKDHSDGEVLNALVLCRSKAISNPVEWLQRKLKGVRFTSDSGHEYRGSLAAIEREAEKRADWNTYWAVKRARDDASEEGQPQERARQ